MSPVEYTESLYNPFKEVTLLVQRQEGSYPPSKYACKDVLSTAIYSLSPIVPLSPTLAFGHLTVTPLVSNSNRGTFVASVKQCEVV